MRVSKETSLTRLGPLRADVSSRASERRSAGWSGERSTCSRAPTTLAATSLQASLRDRGRNRRNARRRAGADDRETDVGHRNSDAAVGAHDVRDGGRRVRIRGGRIGRVDPEVAAPERECVPPHRVVHGGERRHVRGCGVGLVDLCDRRRRRREEPVQDSAARPAKLPRCIRRGEIPNRRAASSSWSSCRSSRALCRRQRSPPRRAPHCRTRIGARWCRSRGRRRKSHSELRGEALLAGYVVRVRAR